MGVPALGRFLHCLPDLGPRLQAPSLQCQRPQHLPPRLNQLQIGRIPRLEDDLPAGGLRQRAQQDIGGPMGTPVIQHRIEPLDVGGKAGLHPFEEIHLVGRGAARIGRGQRLAIGRLEGTTAVVAASPAPASCGPRVSPAGGVRTGAASTQDPCTRGVMSGVHYKANKNPSVKPLFTEGFLVGEEARQVSTFPPIYASMIPAWVAMLFGAYKPIKQTFRTFASRIYELFGVSNSFRGPRMVMTSSTRP
jgi:hypothetical protein